MDDGGQSRPSTEWRQKTTEFAISGWRRFRNNPSWKWGWAMACGAAVVFGVLGRVRAIDSNVLSLMAEIVAILAAVLGLAPFALLLVSLLGGQVDKPIPLPTPRGKLDDSEPKPHRPYVSTVDECIYGKVLWLVAFANVFEQPTKYAEDLEDFKGNVEKEIKRVSGNSRGYLESRRFSPEVCHRISQALAISLERARLEQVAPELRHVEDSANFLLALLKALEEGDKGRDALNWDRASWCLALYVLRIIDRHLPLLHQSERDRAVKQVLVGPLLGTSLRVLCEDEKPFGRIVEESFVENIWPAADTGTCDWNSWREELDAADAQVIELENLPESTRYRALVSKLCSIARHISVASSNQTVLRAQCMGLRKCLLDVIADLKTHGERQMDVHDMKRASTLLAALPYDVSWAAKTMDDESNAPAKSNCSKAIEELFDLKVIPRPKASPASTLEASEPENPVDRTVVADGAASPKTDEELRSEKPGGSAS